MIKSVTTAACVLALTTTFAFAQTPGGAPNQAPNSGAAMEKDGMAKDGMAKDKMGTSGMSKDNMAKDGMKDMSKENKPVDGMKK